MTIYIFSRNKKTGRKKIIQEVETEEEAREICVPYNKRTSEPDWLEWTKDKKYAE